MIQLTSSNDNQIWVNPQAIVMITDQGRRRFREVHLSNQDAILVKETVLDINRLIDQAILPILPADMSGITKALKDLDAASGGVEDLGPSDG